MHPAHSTRQVVGATYVVLTSFPWLSIFVFGFYVFLVSSYRQCCLSFPPCCVFTWLVLCGHFCPCPYLCFCMLCVVEFFDG